MISFAKKRIIYALAATVLVLTTAFTLASCGDEKPTAQQTEAVTEAAAVAPTQAPTEEEELDLSAFIEAFDKEAELTEQVIFDSDGIKLTAKGMVYDKIYGPSVLISAENSGKKDILIQTDVAAVNGYMTAVSFSLEAPAGKNAEGKLTVPYADLAAAGIDRAATLEFSLRILESGSYDVITTTEYVTLTTTAAEGFTQECDESGQQVYSSENYKIVIKGMDESRTLADGAALIVYMYNGSDKTAAFQADDITVNGYELTSAMNTIVLPGKRAVDTVTFFELDLAEYDISEIDSVELSFEILDERTWKTIAKTKRISVELDI